jgi:CheY-like chemotaxis protein
MQTFDNSIYRHPRLCGRRVLVIEDEVLISMMFEKALLDAGAEVVGPAGSVDEALGLIARTMASGCELSAAVLDIRLGGAAVLPVADRLVALGVPFVFATGYGAGCDRGQHTGAPVLSKPFDLMTLVAAVGDLAGAGGEVSRDRGT